MLRFRMVDTMTPAHAEGRAARPAFSAADLGGGWKSVTDDLSPSTTPSLTVALRPMCGSDGQEWPCVPGLPRADA